MHVIIIGFFIVLAIVVTTLLRDASTEEWKAARDIIRPQFTTEQLPVMQQPFVEGLFITYAVHHGDRYTFINEADLGVWEVEGKTVHDRALQNLGELFKTTDFDIGRAGESAQEKYIIVETHDGYDAVRLLNEKVRSAVADQLGEPFIAAIPTRDFLIFWPEGFSVHDQFAAQVKQEFNAGGDYALTPLLFRIVGDRIEVQGDEDLTP